MTYPVIEQPYLPVGNLLVAIILPSFVIFGHSRIRSLFQPVYEREIVLSRISKVILILALLWLAVTYLLAGNLAGNFSSEKEYQGSVLAGEIYRAYTVLIPISAILLWLACFTINLRPDLISRGEIVKVLKRFIYQQPEFRFSPGYYWSEIDTIHISFIVEGYEILIFVDAGELDYIELVKAPDGREGYYSYWSSLQKYGYQDPLTKLTEQEHLLIKQRFEQLMNTPSSEENEFCLRNMTKKIRVDEVVEFLRMFINKKPNFTFSPTYFWHGHRTTTIQLGFDGYEILFFVDAGELDYVDWIKFPDGRQSDYDTWDNDETMECRNPLELITESECEQIRKRIIEHQKQLDSK